MANSFRTKWIELRQRLARFIAPSPPEPARMFYPQQKTCQIRDLDTLLCLFLGRRNDGTFVEIGANDGVFASNTWGLAEKGWRGLMAEPVPWVARACANAHRSHPSIAVHNIAIAGRETTEVKLFIAGPMTTANPTQLERLRNLSWSKDAVTNQEVVSLAMPIDRFLDENEIEPGFDLLVVDVEGFEAEVFSGFTLERWRPKMMIIELLDTHPDFPFLAADDARLGADIVESGYRVVYKDSMNTIFVRNEVIESVYS